MTEMIGESQMALGVVRRPLSLSLLLGAADAYHRMSFDFSMRQVHECICNRITEYCDSEGLTLTRGFTENQGFPPCYEWVNKDDSSEVMKNGAALYADPDNPAWVPLRLSGEFVADAESIRISLQPPPSWYDSELKTWFGLLGLVVDQRKAVSKIEAKDFIKKTKGLMTAMGDDLSEIDSLKI